MDRELPDHVLHRIDPTDLPVDPDRAGVYPHGPLGSTRLLRRRALLAGLGAAGALGAAGLGSVAGCRCVDEPRTTSPGAATARQGGAPSGTATAFDAGPADVFPVIRLAGSHREIGLTMGLAFRQSTLETLRAQPEFEACVGLAAGRLRERVVKLEDAARAKHPGLVDELTGLAEGLGLPFEQLFAWNCRSEIDAAADPCPPGCSTVGTAGGGRMMLGHDEDAHEAYRGKMFVALVTPPSGVRFAALVYPGTLPGNGPGLNEHGVVQTTNYIGPCDAGDGVPRYFVGRAVLEAASLNDAVARATAEPRAFPWHHNLGDLRAGALVSLETWPGRHHRRDVTGLHLHTNHLVHAEMLALAEDRRALDRSSLPRLRRLEQLFAARPPASKAEVLGALRDREGLPCKLCRRPGDPVGGVTVGLAFFESPKLEMCLFDGPQCDGPEQRVTPT